MITYTSIRYVGLLHTLSTITSFKKDSKHLEAPLIQFPGLTDQFKLTHEEWI